jgi:hypothetical protein
MNKTNNSQLATLQLETNRRLVSNISSQEASNNIGTNRKDTTKAKRFDDSLRYSLYVLPPFI